MRIGRDHHYQLSEYLPVSCLVAPENRIVTPRYPVVDAHAHIDLSNERPESAERIVERMDRAGIIRIVDLDAGVHGPEVLLRRLEAYGHRFPDRFSHLSGIDWSAWESSGNKFGERAARALESHVHQGAEGLKIWKDLGLHVRDAEGRLVMLDDPRLNPIWHAAAELRVPVFVHTADPVAFFRAVDGRNERLEQLLENPHWNYSEHGPEGFERLMSALDHVVRTNPSTTFVGAHVGCYAENLAWVSGMLERYPNYWVDISARISELGRQPYSARRFLSNYANRILFGTDTTVDVDCAQTWYRFLETEDEYFAYSAEQIPQDGRWRIYGVGLNHTVLRKLYFESAHDLWKWPNRPNVNHNGVDDVT